MIMNYTLGIFAIMFPAILIGSQADKQKKHYSRKDLIATRIVWASQEDRLEELKREAKETTTHIVGFMDDNRYIAQINANNGTVMTYIPGQNYSPSKWVELSYPDFTKLLSDTEILAIAQKQLQQRKK
jgi:hypothetical protein